MDLGLTTMIAEGYFSDEEICELYKNAGFKYIDYYFSKLRFDSNFFKGDDDFIDSYYKNLKSFAKKVGISFHQTHAPYPTFIGKKRVDKDIFTKTVQSIKASSILGAKYIVVHPQMPRLYHLSCFKGIRKKINMAFYKELIPYLEKYNISLAIENMFHRRFWDKKLVKTVCSRAEEMLDFLAALNHPLISICLDIGHANIIYKDSGIEMLKKLSKHIKLLHIHDNNGISDQHLLPSEGQIDWQKVVATLKEIDYNGVINLECHGSIIKNNPKDIKNNLDDIYARASALFASFN